MSRHILPLLRHAWHAAPRRLLPRSRPRLTPLRLLALALVALPGIALAAAPWLPRYITEGYPAPRWPAAGAHAAIDGVAAPLPLLTDPSGLAPLSAKARRLLEASDGKALLVYHRGRLKLEHYAADAGPDTRFNSYSMAKSLIGALVLKAHAEERIHSLDDPVGRYLPSLGDAAVRARPVSAFLAMRSGLDFENGGKKDAAEYPRKLTQVEKFSPFSHLARLHALGLGAVSDELHVDPRRIGRFDYQNVNTAILGALLEKLYGEPLERLLSRQIWRKAGAASAVWRRYDRGQPVSPYCCIYASARDWLRIGLYLAHNGTATEPFLAQPLWREWFGAGVPKERLDGNHYGEHVYHNICDRAGEPLQGRFTFMFGSRGQIVYMKPEDDLVVVRLGEKVPLLHSLLYAAYDSATRQPPTKE
jgi:CubicO group peptidase (beta-lactamase class C family)